MRLIEYGAKQTGTLVKVIGMMPNNGSETAPFLVLPLN